MPLLPPWMQVEGELRGRLEGQTALGSSQSGAAYLLSRVRGGVRITPARPIQFYLQFQDTHAPGLQSSLVAGNMHDTFDLYQGYVRLQNGPLRLTAGRQQLRFGSERIIGVSDFTNNARSFDGFDFRIGGVNHVDLFTASVVTVHPESLDTHGGGLTFHGAYGHFEKLVPGVTIEPFLLFLEKRNVTDARNISGDESRATFGAEVSGAARSGALGYDAMLALQRGSYASQSIAAGAGFAKLSYAPPRWSWAPRFGAEFDYATGSSAKDLHTQGTYGQLYPSNHDAFGLVDLFGFQNIRQERVNVDLRPSQYLTILVQAGQLNTASAADAVYSSAGQSLVSAPAAGFRTTSLGQEVDVSAKYLFRESVVFNVGIGHLFPSDRGGEASLVPPKTLGFASLTYRFRLTH